MNDTGIVRSGTNQGTCWCVTRDRVITAAHCLEGGVVEVEFAGKLIKAAVLDKDVDLDAAVLKLAEALNYVNPPQLCRRPAQHVNAAWAAFGFPLALKAYAKGFTPTGEFQNFYGKWNNDVDVLELRCALGALPFSEELNDAGDPKQVFDGMSGAAVRLDNIEGPVIGIWIQSPPELRQTITFAPPIASIVERFRHHLREVEIHPFPGSEEAHDRSHEPVLPLPSLAKLPPDYVHCRFRACSPAWRWGEHIQEIARKWRHASDQPCIAFTLHFRDDVPTMLRSLQDECAAQNNWIRQSRFVDNVAALGENPASSLPRTLFLVNLARLIRDASSTEEIKTLVNNLEALLEKVRRTAHRIAIGLHRAALASPAIRALLRTLPVRFEADELFSAPATGVPASEDETPDVQRVIDTLLSGNSDALRRQLREFQPPPFPGASKEWLLEVASALQTHGFLEPAFRLEIYCQRRPFATSDLHLKGQIRLLPQAGRHAPVESETPIIGLLERLSDAPRAADRIILNGEAGSGKSVALAQMEQAWSLARRERYGRPHPCWMPLMLDLQAMDQCELTDWLRRSFRSPALATQGEGALRRELAAHDWLARHVTPGNLGWLFSSSILYLVDGWAALDEPARIAVGQWLEMLGLEFPSAGMVLATRKHEEPEGRLWYQHWFASAHRVEVQPLGDTQVEYLARSLPDESKTQIAGLLDGNSSAVAGFVRNPFLLSCLIEFGLAQPDRPLIRSGENLFTILRRLVEKRLSASEDDVAALLCEEVLPDLAAVQNGLATPQAPRFSPEECDALVARAVQEEILDLPRGRRFSHRLLEDYFIAQWLLRQLRQGTTIPDLLKPLVRVRERLRTRWSYVFRMIVGSDLTPASKAEVLAYLMQHADSNGAPTVEILVLRCAQEQAVTESGGWPAVTRATASLLKRIENSWSQDGEPAEPEARALGPFDPRLHPGDARAGAVELRSDDDRQFWMSRFPVTNLEFARFVQSGGYGDGSNNDHPAAKYWHPAGWKWLLKSKGTIRCPPSWSHWGLNLPNAPVVGVCFHEALAYVRWLAEQMGKGWCASLPNMKQAAIASDSPGLDRIFGAYFESEHAFEFLQQSGTIALIQRHQRAFRNFGPSPVGLFAPFASGASDLFGNVWEWCDEWFSAPLDRDSPSRDKESVSPVRVYGGPVTGPTGKLAGIRELTSWLGGGLDPFSRVSHVGFRWCLDRTEQAEAKSGPTL
jgi:formylglycine-generating enzyme required for sulfatase activity